MGKPQRIKICDSPRLSRIPRRAPRTLRRRRRLGQTKFHLALPLGGTFLDSVVHGLLVTRHPFDVVEEGEASPACERPTVSSASKPSRLQHDRNQRSSGVSNQTNTHLSGPRVLNMAYCKSMLRAYLRAHPFHGFLFASAGALFDIVIA